MLVLLSFFPLRMKLSTYKDFQMASMTRKKIIKNTYRHFFNWFGQVTADRNYSQKLFWIDQVTVRVYQWLVGESAENVSNTILL
jgi:hypothetical protein